MIQSIKIEVKNTDLQAHIRELEAAQAAQKESEERYRMIFTQAGEGIFMVSPEGRIFEVNEAFARMHGYTREEMFTMTLRDLDTPETARHIGERMEQILSGKDITFEVEHYHKDGHVFPLEVSASLITWRGERYVQCFHRDISERRRSDNALKASEDMYRTMSSQFTALLNAIPDSITLISPDYTILWANRTAAERAGADSLAIEGAHCFALWFDRTAPCAECPVQESFRSGNSCEARVARKDRQFEVRAVPVIGTEGVVNVIRVGRDVTEQLKLEEHLRQAQKMESVGTLAGGIAHDFNNILGVIIGHGKLALMKMDKSAPQRRNIEQMLTAVDKATYLTRGLLAFSRKQMSNRTTLDANILIGKSKTFLRRLIREDIDFLTHLRDAPVMIYADPNQIDQVLMNVVINACDAMPNGGTLSIATDVYELGRDFQTRHGYGISGDYGVITVTDNGIGMDEETARRVFEPFFTTKEVGKGTGLGLSIIYGIIKQHEGYITVESEPGKGTTFRIYLPLAKNQVKEDVQENDKEHLIHGTETILLAEDEEMLRNLTKTVLEEFGYEVIEAINGEEMVAKFIEHQSRIRLIVSDLIMPKKSGKEAYDEIRKIRPDVKIIFASGYSPDIVRDKTSLGSEATLIYKPISPIDLLAKIREILDKE